MVVPYSLQWNVYEADFWPYIICHRPSTTDLYNNNILWEILYHKYFNSIIGCLCLYMHIENQHLVVSHMNIYFWANLKGRGLYVISLQKVEKQSINFGCIFKGVICIN